MRVILSGNPDCPFILTADFCRFIKSYVKDSFLKAMKNPDYLNTWNYAFSIALVSLYQNDPTAFDKLGINKDEFLTYIKNFNLLGYVASLYYADLHGFCLNKREECIANALDDNPPKLYSAPCIDELLIERREAEGYTDKPIIYLKYYCQYKDTKPLFLYDLLRDIEHNSGTIFYEYMKLPTNPDYYKVAPENHFKLLPRLIQYFDDEIYLGFVPGIANCIYACLKGGKNES